MSEADEKMVVVHTKARMLHPAALLDFDAHMAGLVARGDAALEVGGGAAALHPCLLRTPCFEPPILGICGRYFVWPSVARDADSIVDPQSCLGSRRSGGF